MFQYNYWWVQPASLSQLQLIPLRVEQIVVIFWYSDHEEQPP